MKPAPMTAEQIQQLGIACYERGRQAGIAEGELRGRIALAEEIEKAFGIDSGHDLTADDVMRIRSKQIH